MSKHQSILILAGLFLLWSSWVSATPTSYSGRPEALWKVLLEWSGEGESYGPFAAEGITVDSWGNVYVTDTINDRVLKFRADGAFVTEWGSQGNISGHFNNPSGLACGLGDQIFVADEANSRVQKFSSSGEFLLEWGIAYWDELHPISLVSPQGICARDDGTIFVTDIYHDGVFVFDSYGEPSHHWIVGGSGPGQLSEPWGLEVGVLNRILVADGDNSRINLYDSSGTFLEDWSESLPFLTNPVDVAADWLDNFYILDRGDRFYYVDLYGNYIFESGGFTDPVALDVYGRGSIYVADQGTGSVVKLGFPPEILSVNDVDDDQGGRVRLLWKRSYLDRIEWPTAVTGYTVYRRQDARTSQPRVTFDHDGKLIEGTKSMEGWDVLVTISAHGDSTYQYVADTLCDSTETGGICWSVFALRAFTDFGEFFDAEIDSGYSVDNIAPAVPSGFTMEPGWVLTWGASSEPDFQYYSVFGSAVDHMDATAVLLSHTIETSQDVSGLNYNFYLLAATDYAGNRSEAAAVGGASAVSEVLPTSVALFPCFPNPFNPQTTIAFYIPDRQAVTLSIFDMSGRLMRNLITAEPHTPGRHEVVWNGRDDKGRQVASGTYFYRLEAGSYSETKRVVLVK